MAATGITAVKDALVARIDANWVTLAAAQLTPPAADQRARQSDQDEVIGRARFDLDAGSLRGRKIVVFRGGRADEPASRSEDQYDYLLALWVVERYTDPGDPSEEWIDERVEWCEWLLTLIGSPRRPPLLADANNPNAGLWPQVAAIEEVYDEQELSENKLFLATLSVTYREQVAEA